MLFTCKSLSASCTTTAAGPGGISTTVSLAESSAFGRKFNAQRIKRVTAPPEPALAWEKHPVSLLQASHRVVALLEKFVTHLPGAWFASGFFVSKVGKSAGKIIPETRFTSAGTNIPCQGCLKAYGSGAKPHGAGLKALLSTLRLHPSRPAPHSETLKPPHPCTSGL